MPAILNSPQPLDAKLHCPRQQHLVRIFDRQLIEQPAGLVDSNRRQRVLVYVHTDHDHCHRLQQQRGATGERTGLTRGSCQAPIKSRSTVSGRRRRHNAGKSAPTDSPEWSQPPPTRVSATRRTPPSPDNDSEFRNVTRGSGAVPRAAPSSASCRLLSLELAETGGGEVEET